ncbi:MAG: zinc-ribbon domain-containing protein [Clostridia bacterium]
MVCRECGAYNAENLTHCRVCAAKLRDTEANAPVVDTKEQQTDARPKRDFVQAPSWPTHAFSGASENPPMVKTENVAVTYSPISADGGLHSAIPSRSAPVSRVACPNCGKPALPDAPFCPYCGQKLTGEEATAPELTASQVKPKSRPAQPAPQPAKKTSKHAPKKDDFDDDDFDDDFDEDEDDDMDDVPQSRQKKVKERKNLSAKKNKYADDDEDDDFDDDEYDDEDEDYDDMPQKKGKGTTILFWGLIGLLVALIAVFGIYIVKKNFGGDSGKLFASISSLFGKNNNTETAPGDGGDTVPVVDDNMNTATISEFTAPDTGEAFYDINVHALNGSSVRIITDATLQSSEPTTITRDNQITLRVAREVFMPNAPCDSELVTVTPNIQVDTPAGETIQLKVDDISITVPVLTMTVDTPVGDTIQQGYKNEPILINGSVANPDIREIYVNDEAYPVYEGGVFTLTYTPKMVANPVSTTAAPTASPTVDPLAVGTDPAATSTQTPTDTALPAEATSEPIDEASATADPTLAGDTSMNVGVGGTETITIEARMNNYVTARKVITIEPYVMQNLSLTVTNDPATGLTSTDGKITIQGTVTEGATLKISSDEAADVTFGEPSVNGGQFSVAAAVNTVGAFDVDITATMEGYIETTVNTIVERSPSEKYSAFLKKCTDIGKSYDKIVAGEVSTGNFYATGTVTEIIGSAPYTVFKVQLSDGKEVICVNRSAKSTINAGDVKQKKQVIGSLLGLYTDGKTPYLWGWFSLNKK